MNAPSPVFAVAGGRVRPCVPEVAAVPLPKTELHVGAVEYREEGDGSVRVFTASGPLPGIFVNRDIAQGTVGFLNR